MKIDYDGRLFRPVSNSPNGQVTSKTLFRYFQKGSLLKVTYSGGGIRRGHALGLVHSDSELEFCYHHVTSGYELRSGFCRSTPFIITSGRIRLEEKWTWTFPERSDGTSVLEEVRPEEHDPMA